MAAGKSAHRRKARVVFFNGESGVLQRPPARRTWAPRARRFLSGFHWTKLSVATGPALRWDGRRGRLYFQTGPGSYDSEGILALLQGLNRDLRGQQVILVRTACPPTRVAV